MCRCATCMGVQRIPGRVVPESVRRGVGASDRVCGREGETMPAFAATRSPPLLRSAGMPCLYELCEGASIGKCSAEHRQVKSETTSVDDLSFVFSQLLMPFFEFLWT